MSFYKEINNNLVIRNGRIACKDGQPLMKYLKSYGHQNGDAINIVLHHDLVRMNDQCGLGGIG